MTGKSADKGRGSDAGRAGATATGGAGQGDAPDTGMKYGGDDGALEHEGGETNTPEDTGSKVEPGRKAGA